MRGIWGKFAGVLILTLMLCAENAHSTHLRTADILVERICGTLTFRITITAYLNTKSSTPFGTNSEVRFGDAQFVKIPQTVSTRRPDLGENVAVATFVVLHTYGWTGEFIISYIEHDRSSGVVNMLESDAIAYTSFVKMRIDDEMGCNTIPILTVRPLDHACSGRIFFHNPGAYDVEGDSLSYEITNPSGGDNESVHYWHPNYKTFYPGFYETGNEARSGPPTFEIDSLTGLLKWDAPGVIGEYNIAFRINEWRKNASGVYVLLSATVRDMQIIVEECLNDRPDLAVPENTCVAAGTSLNKVATGTDVNNDPVKMEVFSEIILLPPDRNPATYSPIVPSFVPSPAQLSIQWNTACTHVRQQPYQVVFKITDNHGGPQLVTYKTWSIQVVGPAPIWKATTLDVVKHHALLEWEPYTCANAEKIQIWRRVGSFDFTPDNCQTGLPGFAGYSLVAEVDPAVSTFTDTNDNLGLAAGAKYCYRLLAIFANTKSYVSDEMCEGPVQADAPVITHVSVEKTAVEGSIRISWRSPLNINQEQFPKPYAYEIYRADGLGAEEAPTLVSGRVQDTTYLDTGINTDVKPFNYRIVLYSKPVLSTEFIAVDTSAAAASVWLSSTPGENEIELVWRDSVPWSNVDQSRPYHLIYRATGAASEEDLELIDSVDVTEEGFHYVDDDKVDPNQPYTYRVQTRGTYGNPAIALQKNFSQLHVAYPKNTLLPCAPTVTIQVTDCEVYRSDNNCDRRDFSNSIQWTPSFSTQCRIDVKSYNIYASDAIDGQYGLIAAGVLQTDFTENNLLSFGRCYRVAAVDGSGQEGPVSDPVCNENCPYYKLPNIFTPNADGCNDVFSARYNMDDDVSQCPVLEPLSCPRFVNSVHLTVLNRWGKEVYQFTSRDNSTGIYIDWNGKDNNNKDLDAGIYYYVADVTYNAVMPANRHQKLKGWVQLMR